LELIYGTEHVAFPKRVIQYIPPRPSHFAIVGEAPGADEDEKGLPFIGGEGRYLTALLHRAGIDRSQVYITNTVHERPEKNEYDNLPPWAIEQGRNQLKKDLEEWKAKGLKTVMALGKHALEMLTGKEAITKFRGSFFPCTLVPGLKVCPTFHPGFLQRGQGRFEQVVIADMKKIWQKSHDSEIHYPPRQIKIITDVFEAIQFLKDMTDIERPVVIDIETKGGLMTAYGIATDKDHAYVIVNYLLKMPSVLKAISRFAMSTTPKIFHNALYDAFHGLHYYHFYYRNIIADTMLMQHCVYPTLPKSLDFCASVYTDEPYWKEEGKDTMILLYKEGLHGEDLWKRLYIYNGKDCCLTYEIYEILLKEIEAWGTQAIFKDCMDLVYPSLYAMERGLLVDKAVVQDFAEKNEKTIEVLEKIKTALLGDINVGSHNQLVQLIYNQWKMPIQKKKGKVTTETDKLEILAKFPTPYSNRIWLIIKLKEHLKMRDFYSMIIDHDGRVRYTIKIGGTYTGRMATSKSITGSGMNYQNQPEEVRIFYIAEKGKIFMEFDLSQSEARIVAALCKDEPWLRAFDERDLHTEVAAFLFDIPASQVDKKKHRYPAKRVAHGTHYEMGFGKLSEIIKCPMGVAKKLRERYHQIRPSLKPWQDSVRLQIDKTRLIRTIFGRVIQFFGPISDEVYRNAIAAEPQSTSVSYINHGIVRAWNEIEHFDFHLQVHDSILIQVDDDPAIIEAMARRVKELVEVPMTINGITFRIPLEFKIGYSWGKLTEVKSPAKVKQAWQGLQTAIAFPDLASLPKLPKIGEVRGKA
jgi:uracil-DNA glycosylase family 4